MTLPQAPTAAGLGVLRLSTLRMVANGLSSVQIAKRMGRSRDAVDNDMRTITAALGALSRTHAVAVAIRLGLIPLDDIQVPESPSGPQEPADASAAPAPRSGPYRPSDARSAPLEASK